MPALNTLAQYHSFVSFDLFFSLIKIGLRVAKSLVLLLTLCSFTLLVIFLYGSSFFSAFLIALISSYTLGRNWISHNREWDLYSLWPACIPIYFFLFSLQFNIKANISVLGPYWDAMNDWLVIGFFLYLLQKKYHNNGTIKPSLLIQILNRIVFIAIHLIYGLAFQVYCPEIIEKIEWGPLPFLKPDFLHASDHPIFKKSNVILYCADPSQEEKITSVFPKVLEAIQSSPFYDCSKLLKVCRKSNSDETNTYQKRFQESAHLKGLFLPFKNYSYVFLPYEDDSILIHALRHELAHQVLALHYGTLPFFTGTIPLWKDEGYAEYLSRFDHPFDPVVWLSLLKEDQNVAKLIADPFSIKKSKSDYCEEDYDAAFLQTFYALKVRSLDPNIFFEKKYPPASYQEIENWLQEASLNLNTMS